jgi:hypothetical protein
MPPGGSTLALALEALRLAAPGGVCGIEQLAVPYAVRLPLALAAGLQSARP